ncbi:MAG: efflux RND transporter permease subunit [Bacteroidales bacterium]
MKASLTEFFIKRPTLFWSLMAALLIAGVLSFVQMPKLEDPAIGVKQAMVVVPYPGAMAHEVELQVAQVMEDDLRSMPNVKKITSECTNGMAMITVEFRETVLMDDIEQHFDQLRRKVSASAMKLPQGCCNPIVVDDMMDVYGMFYALTSDGHEYPEMYKYAKKIRRELLSVKGVKRINIYGNRDEVINITISKEKIVRNGIIPTQIMSVLQDATKTVDAGSYQDDGQKIKLRITDRVQDVEDVQNLIIQTLDGKQIRIGDVAEVERKYKEPQQNGFFVNSEPALAICISTENDAVVPDVGKAVEAKLKDIMSDIPAGLDMEKIFFQPDKVNEAISSFMINLIESVLIVVIVLIFTMGLRSGLIIGAGLIITIAGSFPLLLMCGTTLQRISLGAFIIAMGMLVDNAIVIMDGILVDRSRKLSPKVYLYRICRATAMPLLGATLIAASAFLNVFLSKDTAGEYARDLFLVLCVSLLVSWVLALTQVPVFAKFFLALRIKKVGNEVQNNKAQQLVRKMVVFLIEYKKTTVIVSIAVLIISFAGMGKIKNLFFPDFSYKQFVVEYYAPYQTDPDKVRQDLKEMSRLVKQNPNVERVAASMGSTPARYCLVRPMNNGGDSYGELIIDCPDYETMVDELPKIRKQLRELYPDAYIRARKYNFSVSTSHTVELAFSGPDPAVLRDLSGQAESIMRKSPYVDFYSVQNNWKPMGKSLVAGYMEQEARRSGVSRGNIGNALQAATDGMVCGVINDQDQPVLLNFRIRNSDGSMIKDLSDIPVWTDLNVKLNDDDLAQLIRGSKSSDDIEGGMYKSALLSNVTGKIDLGCEEQMIVRVNGARQIESECDPDYTQWAATPAKVKESIEKEINQIKLPEGYTMEWKGEIATQGDSMEGLMKYLPITLFLVLSILLLLFNNWKKVILILICFPFVMCGITPALLIFKQPLTFMAIIGIMGLMGMMIKNAVVLVDEIARLINEEHQHPYDAVINATVSRTRPVTMASLTTIVGMLPLVTDPMYASMAVTIMSGLTIGTVITLALLPLFYTVLFHITQPQLNKQEIKK